MDFNEHVAEDTMSKMLVKAVNAELEKQINIIAEDLIDDATDKLCRKVRAVVGEIATRVASRVKYESFERELVIKVDLTDFKNGQQ